METGPPSELETGDKTSRASKKNRKKKTKSKQTRKPNAESATYTKERPSNRRGEQRIAYLLIIVMFFMIAIMLFAMHRMNPIF